MPVPLFDDAALRQMVQAKLAQESASPAAVAEKKEGVGVGPYAAMVAGSGADLASTLHAIHSGRGTEANPFLKHGGDAGLIAGKAASTAGLAYLMKKLAEAGHEKLAKGIGYGAGAALGGLAARNSRVGK